MTDNEIIKALECCKDVSAKTCRDCPFYNFHSANCVTVLAEKSLDLIKRQRERIDRLDYNLKAVLSERADHSEAVKEFAERLKKKARVPKELWNVSENKKIRERDIDEVLKEMEAKI